MVNNMNKNNEHDFDEDVNRIGTNCAKYDGLDRYFGYEDLHPMWVADMDFKTPKCVNDAIINAAQNSLYGYSIDSNDVYDSIAKWQKTRHNWDINIEDIFMANGVVPSYSACIEAYSDIGDEVIVQTPVYPPLFKAVSANNRKVVVNELINNDGYYTMDLEDLKSKITPKTKILCLCSPHNPVGRVWNKKELEDLADICIEHNILIISDEIHSDLTFEKFIPLASISEKIAQITLTLNSAGKTFNIAGLNTSYAISKNKEILEKFKKEARKREIHSVNYFGYVATKAAYEHGANFVDELKIYLQKNIKFTLNYLNEHCPKITFKEPQATYLLWLNFEDTGLSHNEIKTKLLTEAKLALNDGVSFGSNGNKFFRLNAATNQKALKMGLEKLKITFP